MSNWKYAIVTKDGAHILGYERKEIGEWNKTKDEQDDSYMYMLINAEVHELEKQIKELNNNIYYLRRFQRTLDLNTGFPSESKMTTEEWERIRQCPTT